MPITFDIVTSAQLSELHLCHARDFGPARLDAWPSDDWLHSGVLAPWPDPLIEREELCAHPVSCMGAPTHRAGVHQQTFSVSGVDVGAARACVAASGAPRAQSQAGHGRLSGLQGVLQDILQQLVVLPGGDEASPACRPGEEAGEADSLPDHAQYEGCDRCGWEWAHADGEGVAFGAERFDVEGVAGPSMGGHAGQGHFSNGNPLGNEAVAADMARALDDFFRLQTAAQRTGQDWCL